MGESIDEWIVDGSIDYDDDDEEVDEDEGTTDVVAEHPPRPVSAKRRFVHFGSFRRRSRFGKFGHIWRRKENM